MATPRIITLTTDFGTRDPYVGQMKGVILSINPQAVIVDLCHEVAAQDVAEAAFVLGSSYRHFPKDTIHIAVVDPGVGTQRRGVGLSADKGIFLAPDNGLLSWVVAQEEQWAAVSLTNPSYWLPQVSTTFHGRDIFAPAAAHLSLGIPLEELGGPISNIIAFPIPQPERAEDGSIVGRVIHTDRFGNAITDLRLEHLPPEKLVIEIGDQQINKISRTYAESEGLTALFGSSGYLEITLKNKSAAAHFGIKRGDRVRVRVT